MATLDGTHLAVYSGNVESLAPSDQFEQQELDLNNVNGVFAKVALHAAKQTRWMPQDTPAHVPGTCIFQEAATQVVFADSHACSRMGLSCQGAARLSDSDFPGALLV